MVWMLVDLMVMSAEPLQHNLRALSWLVLPPGMNPLPGTAKMVLHAEGGGQVRDVEYLLVDRAAPQDVPLPDGAHARAYGLSASDAAAMRALQAEAALWIAARMRGSVRRRWISIVPPISAARPAGPPISTASHCFSP